MMAANWHTYQILTKRAERMREIAGSKLRFAAAQPHIWWGVSVENRKHGLPRIDQAPQRPRSRARFSPSSRCWKIWAPSNLTGINWVIVGGESGPGARPMDAGVGA